MSNSQLKSQTKNIAGLFVGPMLGKTSCVVLGLKRLFPKNRAGFASFAVHLSSQQKAEGMVPNLFAMLFAG